MIAARDEAGAQERPLSAGAAVERFAVGADRGRVAEGDEQVGAELQQPGRSLPVAVRPHALDQVEGVAVRPDRRGRSRRRAGCGGRPPRVAGFQQVVADLRGEAPSRPRRAAASAWMRRRRWGGGH